MMTNMKTPTLWLTCAVAVLGGCAHAREPRETHEPQAVRAPSPRGEREAASDPEPASAFEAPPTHRPRLSRTITLGQGESTYTDGRASGPAQAPAGGPSVIVNNQIVVPPSPSVVYGGYGYGYGGGYGAGYGVRGERLGPKAGYGGYGQQGTGGAYGAAPGRSGTGWEGAQRTAAPGQTPAVGGNWAPVQDFGPRPMR